MIVDWGNGRSLELNVSRQEYHLLCSLVRSKLKRIAKADTITKDGMKQQALLSIMSDAISTAENELKILPFDDSD